MMGDCFANGPGKIFTRYVLVPIGQLVGCFQLGEQFG